MKILGQSLQHCVIQNDAFWAVRGFAEYISRVRGVLLLQTATVERRFALSLEGNARLKDLFALSSDTPSGVHSQTNVVMFLSLYH